LTDLAAGLFISIRIKLNKNRGILKKMMGLHPKRIVIKPKADGSCSK
jgi:hypothetical protein